MLNIKYFTTVIKYVVQDSSKYEINYICISFHSTVQEILKWEVSLYNWPPSVWLVWNQLYDNWQFLILFAKRTNPNQSNRRSTVQWYCTVWESKNALAYFRATGPPFVRFVASSGSTPWCCWRLSWAQCYKTFFGRNWRKEVRVFVSGTPLQPRLLFPSKAGAYPRVEHLKV